MKNILVFGAGLSSSYLFKYLKENAGKEKWQISICDANIELAKAKAANSKHCKTIQCDVHNVEQLNKVISQQHLVISLLPPALHVVIAQTCIAQKTPLITASYVSPEMRSLDAEAKKAGIILLNEMGLDPGIDHLSAMKLIDEIHAKGGKINSFKSFCGGLVAPEFDNNPWKYKFTWNPLNVVVAGQATATHLQEGKIKYIPAHQIFKQTQQVKVPGYGNFEAYANRDSISYIEPYGLQKAKTVLRGTLRRPGFCNNWQQLIALGLTDASKQIVGLEKESFRNFIASFVPMNGKETLEQAVANYLGIKQNSTVFKNLIWLGLFKNDKIGLKEATPSAVLLKCLLNKWQLKKNELDMVVMKHEITYTLHKKEIQIGSSFVIKGEDQTYTAMAKTVGLPMAIAAKNILNGTIQETGVHIPILPCFYEPILKELQVYGIDFTEKSYPLSAHK